MTITTQSKCDCCGKVIDIEKGGSMIKLWAGSQINIYHNNDLIGQADHNLDLCSGKCLDDFAKDAIETRKRDVTTKKIKRSVK